LLISPHPSSGVPFVVKCYKDPDAFKVNVASFISSGSLKAMAVHHFEARWATTALLGSPFHYRLFCSPASNVYTTEVIIKPDGHPQGLSSE
jgi:hypothetical protein